MAVYSFKVRGLTAASATIATLDVSYDADGFLRWTDTAGSSTPRSLKIDGNVGEFLKEIFTGTGGITASSTGVQGHTPFGDGKVLQ